MREFETMHMNDPAFGPERWQELFDFLKMICGRYDLSMASQHAGHVRERFQARYGGRMETYSFAVLERDRITGTVELDILRADPANPVAFLRTELSYEEPPSGFVSTLAAELTSILNRAGMDSSSCMTPDRRNELLAEALKGERLNRLDRYRLYRSRANVALMDEWLRDYPKRFPQLRLIFFETVPDEYAEQYISLFEQCIREMPTEHKDTRPFNMNVAELRDREAVRRKVETHLYTFALLDEDGRMIGHTNGAVNGRSPREMYQAMSGLTAEYRGKGLSKWMKAALFRKVGADFPGNEILTTDMRAVNKPIEVINRQIGYELFSQGGEYILHLDNLAVVGGNRA